MAVIETTKTKLTTIENYNVGDYTCSAIAAMVIVGSDLYCIKSTSEESSSSSGKLPIVFHEIGNFTSSSRTKSHCAVSTSSGSTLIAEHANSLTYENGTFYVATQNEVGNGSQVVGFGADGVITKKLTYTKVIYSINYFDTSNGNKRFLVCVGKNTSGTFYYKYELVYLSGSTLVYNDVSFNLLGSDGTYTIGNDSFYDVSTKQLYTTMFKGDPVKNNLILQYDLSAGVSSVNYTATRVLHSAATTENKYEIEGVGIYDDKKYVCTNTNDSAGSEGNDGIYKIVKA